VQGDRALIITEDVVEQRAYHDEFVAITWEHCTLRQYLNSEFLNKFDQSKIIAVTNSNADNPWSGAAGGNNTEDKIFLLSLHELCSSSYFGNSVLKLKEIEGELISDENNSRRVAKFNNELSWWWLRSPGGFAFCDRHTREHCAANVFWDGRIRVRGHYVSDDSGIRPALWLRLCGGNK
jgi:hypothetical protein